MNSPPMKFEPHDIGVWLAHVDVNALSDDDQEELAKFDPTTDQGLDRIVREWIKPRFEAWDEKNQAEMLSVLTQSQLWSKEQLTPIFEEFAFPGVDADFDRLLVALRRYFLI